MRTLTHAHSLSYAHSPHDPHHTMHTPRHPPRHAHALYHTPMHTYTPSYTHGHIYSKESAREMLRSAGAWGAGRAGGTRGRADTAVWSAGRAPPGWGRPDFFLFCLQRVTWSPPTSGRRFVWGNPLIAVLIPSKKTHPIETPQMTRHLGTVARPGSHLKLTGWPSPGQASVSLPRSRLSARVQPGENFDAPRCPGMMSRPQVGISWRQVLWADGVPAVCRGPARPGGLGGVRLMLPPLSICALGAGGPRAQGPRAQGPCSVSSRCSPRAACTPPLTPPRTVALHSCSSWAIREPLCLASSPRSFSAARWPPRR